MKISKIITILLLIFLIISGLNIQFDNFKNNGIENSIDKKIPNGYNKRKDGPKKSVTLGVPEEIEKIICEIMNMT